MTEIIEEYIQEIKKDYNVVLNYRGIIKHDIITEILSSIKYNISENYMLSMRVYGVVNELLENIIYHSKDVNRSIAEVFILKNSNDVRVITFNDTKEQDYNNAYKKSLELNNIKTCEIKENMMNKLLNNKIERVPNKQMGIGMEMIRIKSKGKIKIEIEELASQKKIITDVKINMK